MQLLRDWKFLLVTLLAVVGLGLVWVNVSIHSANRDRQADVAERQQFINESVPLSRLNTQFIQALAQLSAQSDDDSIRQLLADHGVTFTVNLPEDAAATSDE